MTLEAKLDTATQASTDLTHAIRDLIAALNSKAATQAHAIPLLTDPEVAVLVHKPLPKAASPPADAGQPTEATPPAALRVQKKGPSYDGAVGAAY